MLSFLWNWIVSALEYLGIVSPSREVLVLGLDNAGKTTLIHMFRRQYEGLIFVVDSADKERLEEARIELERVLESQETKHAPLVILGNKIDRKNAVTERELREALQLPEDTTTGRPVRLFMCSVVYRQGYMEALRWLAQRMR